MSVKAAQQPKRGRRRIGNILRIQLDSDLHAYAQVAQDPLIVFFEGVFTDGIPVERIPHLPVAFRLWVYKYAVTKGVWPVTGWQPLTPENAQVPFFFKQDSFNGRLFLYNSSLLTADQGYERPAILAECSGLERAAVWDPEHVVDRLRDHAAGRPNQWVESLKINIQAIPA